MDSEPQGGVPVAPQSFARRQFAKRRRPPALGAVALVLGDATLLLGRRPLLDRHAALPIGEAGKRERDENAGREASGENVAPPRCAAPAFGDKCLRLLSRRRRVSWTGRDPSLGLFENGGAQQQSAGSPRRGPAARRFAVIRVLPDPADIGLQCLRQLVGARLEALRIVEEDKVQPPQRIGDLLVGHAPADDRCEPLVERGRVRDLLQRHLGRDRVRREHEDDRVGARDQRLDAFPPILEGVDLGAIDQRLEAPRLERGRETIREAKVFARIGDEDSWFRLGVLCWLGFRHENPLPGNTECPKARNDKAIRPIADHHTSIVAGVSPRAVVGRSGAGRSRDIRRRGRSGKRRRCGR